MQPLPPPDAVTASQLLGWVTPFLQAALVGAVGLLVTTVRGLRQTMDKMHDELRDHHATIYGVGGVGGLHSQSAEYGRVLGDIAVWRAQVDADRRQHAPGRRLSDRPAEGR